MIKNDGKPITVWVFNGNSSRFPSAIFMTKELAVRWIESNNLSGTLTCYPIDVPVYAYAIENGWFKPTKDKHLSNEFIANFSSAAQEHYHYENSKD